MTYGLRVINNDSELLLDSDYVNPTFIQKVEFGTTPLFTEVPLTGPSSSYRSSLHPGYLRRRYITPIVSLNTGNYMVLWTLPENVNSDVWYTFQTSVMDSNRTLTCDVYSTTSVTGVSYQLPTAYIFATNAGGLSTLSSSDPGLRLYNSSGQLTFNSNFVQLVPNNFSNSYTAASISGGSVSLDISGPTNPIYVLPRNTTLIQSVRDVTTVDEIFFESGYRRQGSTVYTKQFSSYWWETKNVSNPPSIQLATYTYGNTNNLSIAVADSDFYQSAGGGNINTTNPTYSLSADYVTVNETTNNSLVITLTTTLVPNNTSIYYTITGISAQDLVNGAGGITGAFVIQNNTASVWFQIKTDSVTEGQETLLLTLNGINSSISVNITDTSRAPYGWSAPSSASIDEGSQITVDFNARFDDPAYPVTFSLAGPSTGAPFEIINAYPDITYSYASPVGAFYTRVTLNARADLQQELPEVFRVKATVSGNDYYSSDITINDTVTSSVTASNNWTVGTDNTVTITVVGGLGSTVYLYVNDTSVINVKAGNPTSFYVNSNNFTAVTTYQALGLNPGTYENVGLYLKKGDEFLSWKYVTTSYPAPVLSWNTPSSINEGNTGSLQFNYTNLMASTVISFAVSYGTNVNSSDITLNTTSYTVPANGNGSVSVGYSATADSFTEGAESFVLYASITGSASKYSDPITINDTSTTPVPAYSITANSTPWNENSIRVCEVSIQNAMGSTFELVSDNSQVTSQVSSIYINSNNYSTLTYWTVGEVTANVTVNMALKVPGTGTTGGYNGGLVATTSALVRNVIPAGTPLRYYCSGVDKYVVKADGTYGGEYTELYQVNSVDCGYIPPSWALASNPTSVNEGGSITITLTTNQTGNFAYTISGVTSADIGDAALTGTLANAGTRSITLTADTLTEGTEYLTLALDNGQASVTVAIGDTSKSSVSINQSGSTYGTKGSSFAKTFTTTVNGSTYPAQWSYSGDLPPGLTLTKTSNVFGNYYISYYLSGTPTTVGTYNFTIYTTASSNSADTASTSYSVVVYEASGIYYSQFCSGVDLYYVYHNGSGGYYNALQEANNIGTCGYIPPSWSLSATPTSANEGGSTTITLTTNQSGNFAYTISGVSSADIGNASLTGTLANGGTRSITFTADSSTEGTEYLTLSLDNGQASTTVTVNDTSRNVLAISQGGSSSGTAGSAFSMSFITTVNGSQYPAIWSYSGSIPPGTSFTQSGNTFSNFYQMYYLSGTPTAAGTYSFTVYATASTGESVSASYSVTIAPTPTYSLTRSTTNVNEGGSFTITFNTNQAGNFGYTITGVSSADISNASLTGTVSNGSVLTYTATADATSEGAETFSIALDNGQASTSVTINDTSIPTYSLTPNVSSVNEGGSFTITFATNQSGSFAYTISGVSSADIGGAPLTGNITNGSILGYNVTADITTEGYEAFSISLDNGQASASVGINDTSVATYSLTPSVSSVNEGGSFNITFNSNQAGNFAYTISGVSSADIGGASLTGTVSNGSVLSYTATADSSTEGTETFSISLNNGLASTSVTINDTSKNVLTINRSGDSSGTAGSSFSSTFTVTVNGSQYPAIWSYSGAIPPGMSFTQAGSTYSNFYLTYVLSGTPTTAGTYYFTVYATASNGESVSVAFSVTIAPTPTYSLTRDTTNVNEGGSFTITFNTNQSGSFGYTITGVSSADIGGAPLTGNITNGSILGYNVTADVTSEGAETFNIALNNGQASTSVTINDTSVPTYSLTRSVTSVNEGGSFTVTFATNQSGSFGYTISGVSSADISNASLTGTVSNGSVLTYTAAADTLTEGAETFTISLDNGQASTSVTINDTSTSTKTIELSGSTTGTVGTSYGGNFIFRVNGVQTGASWSYSGTIPYGLTLTQNAGGTGSYQLYTLSGTPTTAGTFTFTINAGNGLNSTSQSFTITISNPSASYGLYNTWSSLANGSSSSFFVRSNWANGATLTPSISGAGAGRVSVSPTSSVISGNGTVDTYFTVTSTSPSATIAAQSVTISVAGTSFTFDVQAYTYVAAAPLVTSVTHNQFSYEAGEDIVVTVNFDGAITSNTIVRVNVNLGTYSYVNQVFTGGSAGFPLGATYGTWTAYTNPGDFYTNGRASARCENADGSTRQSYVSASGIFLMNPAGGGGGGA